eukprot:Seg1816.10 transcript_id=Seg1816.10/GoldUCD/mRNA.D3Y31 product="RNA polymerase-associated protein LEO1" protein_id=Seg1816.10/GoldUCD/D3Y31
MSTADLLFGSGSDSESDADFDAGQENDEDITPQVTPQNLSDVADDSESNGEHEEEEGANTHRVKRQQSEASEKDEEAESDGSASESGDDEDKEAAKRRESAISPISDIGQSGDEEDEEVAKRRESAISPISDIGESGDEDNHDSNVNKKSLELDDDLFDKDDNDDDDAQNNEDKDGGEEKKTAAPTQEDIFGEELDVSSDEDDAVTQSQEEEKQTAVMEEDEEGTESQTDSQKEEQQQPEEGVAIEIELPKVDDKIGDEVFFVKLPNFLSVETKPFDSAFYEDEIDEDEVLDDEGRARLKLKVENTLRWRHGKDQEGNEIKESNARVVKWSDGSLSLHLGNEIFDIFKMPIEGLQNHLFVQQGTGLQAKTVFKEKLTFRPYSTKSQTHLKMTMSIADKVSKAQKIRLIPVTERDPEAARREMTKKEDERMRAQTRRESQQRRIREKNSSKGLTANYLESEIFEDDEQELEESLAAIKNKYKKDIKAGRSRELKDIYSDDDSDDDRLMNAKVDLSSDEDGPRGAKRKSQGEEASKKKKLSRKIVESDEDSE